MFLPVVRPTSEASIDLSQSFQVTELQYLK
jgi:hypothetical protein